MHTVIETRAFIRQAAAAGLREEEVQALVERVARDPRAGQAIPGTGGCRKLRLAGRGKGKSGGYQVVTFYTGETIPVFLLAVFSKGERADLRASERGALAVLTKELAASYGRGTGRIRS